MKHVIIVIVLLLTTYVSYSQGPGNPCPVGFTYGSVDSLVMSDDCVVYFEWCYRTVSIEGTDYYDLWIGTMVFVGDCTSYINNFNTNPELFRRLLFTHILERHNPWNAPTIPICPELSSFYCRIGSVACYIMDYGSYVFPDETIKIGTIIGVCSHIYEKQWFTCFEYYRICYELINGVHVLQMTPFGENSSPNCPEDCVQSCEF